MTIDEIARWLEQRLPAQIPGCGLMPGTTRVEYVMNWGGFVNHSFHVFDGAARCVRRRQACIASVSSAR